MGAAWYGKGKEKLDKEGLDTLNLDSLVITNTPGYTYDPDHATIQALLATGAVEAAASGYSRPSPIAGVTQVYNPATNKTEFTFTDEVFASIGAGETWQYVIIYIRQTNDADHIPLFYFEPDTPIATNGENITLNFGAVNATIEMMAPV